MFLKKGTNGNSLLTYRKRFLALPCLCSPGTAALAQISLACSVDTIPEACGTQLRFRIHFSPRIFTAVVARRAPCV